MAIASKKNRNVFYMTNKDDDVANDGWYWFDETHWPGDDIAYPSEDDAIAKLNKYVEWLNSGAVAPNGPVV